MKWQEAIDLTAEQFRSINRKDLSARMKVLTSVANKRLSRLAEQNIKTPASKYEKFSVKGKDLNQLKKEFSRVRQFLNLKSSTVKGAKQIYKEFKTRLGRAEDIDTDDFWEAYNKIKQTDKALITRLSSEQVQSLIFNMMVEGKDINKIVSEILSPENYEESVEEEVDPFELLEEDFY